MKFKFLASIATAALVIASGYSNAAMISVESVMTGNTYNKNFNITNSSDAGIQIDSLTFDLRPLSADGICFDLVSNSCHSSAGSDFVASMGLTATGFLAATFSDAAGGVSGVLDFLMLDFSNFDASETFGFRVDLDNNTNGSVFGDDLIGAIMTFNMSDGNSYQATYVAGNAPETAQLSAASVVNANISAPSIAALLGLGFAAVFMRRSKA